MTKQQRLFASIVCGGIVALAFDARWAYSVQQLCLYVLAIVIVVQGKARFHWMAVPIAGAVAIGVVQIATNTTSQQGATWIATLDWFSWLVAFSLGAALASESILTAVGVFSGLVSILAVGWRFTKIVEGVPNGPMGPFAYENQFAAFVEMTLPLVLLNAAKGKRIWMGLGAAMIASVMVSGSQAGATLVVLETVVLLVIVARQSGNFKPLAVIGAMVAVMVAVTGWQLLEKDLRRDNPFEVRRQLAQATIEMIKDRPVVGFGLGTWPTAYPAYAKFDDGLFDNQAHNDWLQWAAEGGLPLAVLMLVFAAGLLKKAIKMPLAIGLLCVLVHALVDYPFQQRPALACFFFALAGISSKRAN
jgi:O-antigen ligase